MSAVRPAAALRMTLLVPALVCIACAAIPHTPLESAPAASGKQAGMHDAAARPAPALSARAITAETMARRWLEFTRAARSGLDLERGRFWKTMGLPLHKLSQSQYFAEEAGYQAFTQELADSKWSGTASFGDGDEQSGSRFARLAFEHPDNRLGNVELDLGPVCGVDLAGFRKALRGAGYMEGPTEPSALEYDSKGSTTIVFIRGALQVSLVAQREAAQPQARRERVCVLSAEARAFAEDTGSPQAAPESTQQTRARASTPPKP